MTPRDVAQMLLLGVGGFVLTYLLLVLGLAL